MLTFKQFLALLEALNPIQKQVIDGYVPDREKVHNDEGYASRTAVALSSHLMPPTTHHMIIPIAPSNEPIPEHPIYKKVREHLKAHGYDVQDGMALKPPNQRSIEIAAQKGIEAKPQKVAISKVLSDTNADNFLQAEFNNRIDGDLSSTHHILLSREAGAIAGCGTNNNLEKSCITVNKPDASDVKPSSGTHARDRIPDEIVQGTHVAYLVPKKFAHLSPDEQIKRAVSRVLLKPFNSDSSNHMVLHPENQVYSELKAISNEYHKNRFLSSVQDFAKKHFTPVDALYNKNEYVYDDSAGEQMVINPEKIQPRYIKSLNNDNLESERLYDIPHEKMTDDFKTASKNSLMRKLSGEESKVSWNNLKHLQHAIIHGYYDKELHDTVKKSVLKKLNKDTYDESLIKLLSGETFLSPVNTEIEQKYSIPNDFDDELIRATKSHIFRLSRKGELNGTHVRHAFKYGYADDSVKQNIEDNIRNGLSNNIFNYNIRSTINVADEKNCLSGNVKRLVGDYITKSFDTDKFHDGYNNEDGLINPDIVEHGIKYGYFGDEQKRAMNRFIIRKLDSGTNFSEISKLLGYVDENSARELKGSYKNALLRASKKSGNIKNIIAGMEHANKFIDMDDNLNTNLRNHLIKHLSKRGFVENIGKLLILASKHGYFNDDLKQLAKTKLIEDLRKGKYDYNHVYHAKQNGYMDDNIRKLVDDIEIE